MALLDTHKTPLTTAQVAHLLRRTTFGHTPSLLSSLSGKKAEDIIQILLTDKPAPAPPTDENGQTFHDLPFGFPETVDADKNKNDGKKRARIKWWTAGLMVNQPASILEKMTLFWQNHFVSTATVVSDARFIYRQSQLLRKYALGNFKTFVVEITKDPAMLLYLNGNQNVVGKPNENYGRELQELFTIGRGNYDENDVKAASKVLTGWRPLNYRSAAQADIGVEFRPASHDTTDKVFSASYQNTVIKGRTGATAGEEELNDLINMILAQDETARFIVRKFYRWFVQADISPQIETEVIEPLAKVFRKDYEIKPVLQTLFRSNHFYDENLIGSQIKSPLDLIVGTMRIFNQIAPDSGNDRTSYDLFTQYVYSQAKVQQMDIFDQPTVFGWRPYYDTDFYEIWINSTTLALRGSFTDAIVKGSNAMKINIDSVNLAKQVSEPSDPVILINELSENMYPFALTQEQKDYLIDQVLIPGLPRYEWQLEWQAYTSDPTNNAKRNAVKLKLNSLLQFMLRLAEYQMG
ncbi:Uncharacterized conserved protein, DUF1800 family [Pseudarcicella hirudinis]|uniref:Uncharacterized conserved protein, DUF1800 family n=1 Tax=Pseudarcicella hirudinis TaxID=1079859 RepID=A0A1I5NPC1_9BACT|nr:DUF1800 domain-containing protein [Pseudarcicella hirudinis]SFP23500.1 Uncharacterized conserved protein, DUF1800 family [Pseudarcicella hirudinis]